jgi:hypothetical protein
LTIYAQIPESVTDEGLNTTNFACIYDENGDRVACDDAVYHPKKDTTPPPSEPGDTRNPSCRRMEVNGSTVTCYSNGISARFRLKC